MRTRSAIVTVGVLLAVAGASMWVPVKWWHRGYASTVRTDPQGVAIASTLTVTGLGRWARTVGATPTRYCWVWDRACETVDRRPDTPVVREERVYWPWIALEFAAAVALVALLGWRRLTGPTNSRNGRWRFAAIASGVALALGTTLVLLPLEWRYRGVERRDAAGRLVSVEPGAWGEPWHLGWQLAWTRSTPGLDDDGRPHLGAQFINWRILAAEQVLILALGGGLLTWTRRIDRRHRA